MSDFDALFESIGPIAERIQDRLSEDHERQA